MINIKKKDFFNGVRNSIANLYDPILLAIFTPIFIKNLTLETYGIWVLIFSIANFTKLGSSGVSHSIVKFLGNSDNYKIQKKYLANIFFLFISYTLILIILFSLIVLLLDIENFFELKTKKNIKFLLILAVVFISLKIFEDNILSIYLAYEDFRNNVLLKITSKTIIFITQTYFVIFYKDIFLILEFSCLLLFLIIIVQIILINKEYKIFEFKKITNFIEISTTKKIITYSKGLILSNIAGLINFNIDKIIVATFLGLKTLAIYNLAFMIFSFIFLAFNSFFYYMFPKIAKIKNRKLVFSEFITAQRNILVLGLIGIFLISVSSDFFLKIWLGDSYVKDIYEYHKLFLLINFLILPSIPIYYYLVSLNNTMLHAKLSFYSLFLSTILILFFGYFFSVYGIILSKIYMLLTSIIGFVYIYKNKSILNY